MMRTIFLAMTTTAAVFAALPLSANPAAAQVDVRVGPRGADVEIGTEGRRYRDRDCKTVRVTEWRDGARVTKTVRRCRDD
jgi:hypothetical protein